MSDPSDVLLELRDVGIRQLPEPGDAGDRRVHEALTREMTGARRIGLAGSGGASGSADSP